MVMSGPEKPAAAPARRGFALLWPVDRSRVAAKGGASILADKRSFSTDWELAKKAGQVGGTRSRYPAKSTEPTGGA